MGEITDYILLYLEQNETIKDKVDEIAMNLETNIKREAPYKQGRLKRSIRVDTRMYKGLAGLITGYWDEGLAPHGIFVLDGSKAVSGKLMNMPWGYRTKRKAIPPNDFLGRGLERTLEAYR